MRCSWLWEAPSQKKVTNVETNNQDRKRQGNIRECVQIAEATQWREVSTWSEHKKLHRCELWVGPKNKGEFPRDKKGSYSRQGKEYEKSLEVWKHHGISVFPAANTTAKVAGSSYKSGNDYHTGLKCHKKGCELQKQWYKSSV